MISKINSARLVWRARNLFGSKERNEAVTYLFWSDTIKENPDVFLWDLHDGETPLPAFKCEVCEKTNPCYSNVKLGICPCEYPHENFSEWELQIDIEKSCYSELLGGLPPTIDLQIQTVESGIGRLPQRHVPLNKSVTLDELVNLIPSDFKAEDFIIDITNEKSIIRATSSHGEIDRSTLTTYLEIGFGLQIMQILALHRYISLKLNLIKRENE